MSFYARGLSIYIVLTISTISTLTMAGPCVAQAQTSLHCTETSLAKLADSIGPIANGVQILSLVLKDGALKSKLALVAASAGALSSVYNTYFKGSKTFYDCTAPSGLGGPAAGANNVRLIATADAARSLAGPSGQINWAAVSPQLQQNYAKLSPILGPSPALPSPPQAPMPQRPWIISNAAADSTTVRGYIEDGSGRRLEDVGVQIISAQNGNAWVSQLTNWDGAFEIAASPGKYVIYVHTDGYADFTMSLTKEGYRSTTLPIHLQHEEGRLSRPELRAQPSFDCAKASTASELIICQDPPVALLKALWEREALSQLGLDSPDLCR